MNSQTDRASYKYCDNQNRDAFYDAETGHVYAVDVSNKTVSVDTSWHCLSSYLSGRTRGLKRRHLPRNSSHL